MVAETFPLSELLFIIHHMKYFHYQNYYIHHITGQFLALHIAWILKWCRNLVRLLSRNVVTETFATMPIIIIIHPATEWLVALYTKHSGLTSTFNT